MKRALFAFLILSASVHAMDPAIFEEILKRVSRRDKITKAILEADTGRTFKLEIKGDKATVRIFRHMKVEDKNKEKYVFPLTDEIKQEHVRLELYKELLRLMDKCGLIERKYRISQYKKHKLELGAPLEKVTKILGDDAKRGQPAQWGDLVVLSSATHSFEFRYGKLYDIRSRK